MSLDDSVPDTDAIRLGNNLRGLRAVVNQTQADTAQRAGIARAHYAALENGSSSNGGPANPRLTTLIDLAAALNTHLGELLAGIPTNPATTRPADQD